jgi:hypothetical protein
MGKSFIIISPSAVENEEGRIALNDLLKSIEDGPTTLSNGIKFLGLGSDLGTCSPDSVNEVFDDILASNSTIFLQFADADGGFKIIKVIGDYPASMLAEG